MRSLIFTHAQVALFDKRDKCFCMADEFTSLTQACLRLGRTYTWGFNHLADLGAIRIDGRWFVPNAKLPALAEHETDREDRSSAA